MRRILSGTRGWIDERAKNLRSALWFQIGSAASAAVIKLSFLIGDCLQRERAPRAAFHYTVDNPRYELRRRVGFLNCGNLCRDWNFAEG